MWSFSINRLYLTMELFTKINVKYLPLNTKTLTLTMCFDFFFIIFVRLDKQNSNNQCEEVNSSKLR